jgi:hypothetical protein
MARMATMIKKQGFQGYVSFESLSDGNPKEIIKNMLLDFKGEFENQ